jgi:hypothetical protein
VILRKFIAKLKGIDSFYAEFELPFMNKIVDGRGHAILLLSRKK